MSDFDDLPKHYTDGSQGKAVCGACAWEGLELDVPPVAWDDGEESTCPECGAEAVFLEDPEESNVGREPTYLILTSDPPAIQCLVCGRTSYSPGDVENRYCGYCEEFHEDRVPR